MAPKNTPAAQAKPALAGMGDLSSLLAKPKGPATDAGSPREMSVKDIEEDPDQPRVTFDQEALDELAETIRDRGVKTPISVRPHPDRQGAYIINHGARRYRASIIAGKTTIPAFIDADYNSTDQVVENLQREALSAREVADFIGRELSSGRKQADIARALGKSRGWVSQHATLLDLPDAIAVLFNSGGLSDVALINEICVLHRDYADDVEEWLNAPSTIITRESFRILRSMLRDEGSAAKEEQPESGKASKDKGKASKEAESASSVDSDPSKIKKAIVAISYDGRNGRLILNKRPSDEGRFWIKCDDDGEEIDVSADQIILLSLIEG
ncbi:ParB/RepB/Spo0J family partition protein [Novosphingobium terrae]|uniref:ParB/RepB/Spo0J family partition protein n=1 Tax=Novosphingobium terrae TaxID=2726189 RepID=UPI00197CE5AD|nr:ParB/RepB/Spo0J family partition protein [Novosphingobium terrae]